MESNLTNQPIKMGDVMESNLTNRLFQVWEREVRIRSIMDRLDDHNFDLLVREYSELTDRKEPAMQTGHF